MLRVAPVELVVSSVSSRAVRQAWHSQWHGFDASNVSSRPGRVETWEQSGILA